MLLYHCLQLWSGVVIPYFRRSESGCGCLPRRNFRPDQETKLVAVIVDVLRLRVMREADKVGPKRLDVFQVLPVLCCGNGLADAWRKFMPIDAAQCNGLAIQSNSGVTHCNLTKANPERNYICWLTLRSCPQGNPVKHGMLWRPCLNGFGNGIYFYGHIIC